MPMTRAWIFGVVLVMAGCDHGGLHDLRSNTNGPNEFKVVPAKPLSAPSDFASLPEPTPGGTNRTDINPLGDAVAALGGRGSLLTATTLPASDAGLVNHAARYGASADIRAQLAESDEKRRISKGRFTKLKVVKTDRYSKIYTDYHLDPYAELIRWRKAGARTPAAPPPGN